ncbi:MAG: hypothetical protein NTW30_04585 [Candidatus Aenigmarchaeota archaeon]|nr:hypothetical protein [Candidatus Aenigmarchaeota archaeon]
MAFNKKILPFYLGSLGIFLIIFEQLSNFFKIKPLTYFYTSTLWCGYILVMDSAVHILSGKSYIINRPKKFIFIVFLSALLWLIFEFYNIFLGGWYYIGIPTEPWKCINCYIAFSTILPAVFETAEFIKSLRIFQKTRIQKITINKSLLYFSILVGLIMIVMPFLYYSPYMWGLVWIGFILLIDPINYLFHEKSLIEQIKSGKLNVVFSLFLAGYICGFFWEVWNYWASAKWYYTVPILDEIKIFEIPFLGFFAYGFFAWELYVMYYFVKLLLPKKLEKELELR